MKKIQKQAFTLVELIVVITILAILGTIAFISFQNYTKNSRDGVRIADINSVKKTLELFITDKGFYPLPDNSTPITYSGATVWIQGTIGDNVITNLGRINKKPVDPLTNSEYTYSLTSSKTEYQLSYVTEDSLLGYNLPLLKQANAATTKTAIAMVTGTYNEKMLKVSTGSNYYILAIPSIVNANLSDTNLQSIIDNKELVYNKYSNIPDSYKNKGFTMTGGFDFVPGSNIVVYSGITSSTLSTNEEKRVFLDNLKKVYNGSIIQSEPVYTEVLSTDTTNINSTVVALVDTFINNNVGGITGTPTPIVYGCAAQPSYSGATFTAGIPTLVNQTWQGTGITLPCYYTCGTGKVLVGEECVTEGCAGTTPDGIAKISNATVVNGGTWNYSTTGGVCTYTCNSDYNWDGSSCLFVDTQAPTGGDFTMPTTTSSTGVILTITCPTDNISTGTQIQMYLSGTGLASGGGIWESCVSSKAINITSGVGSKNINIKWRDGSNNETNNLTKTIDYILSIGYVSSAITSGLNTSGNIGNFSLQTGDILVFIGSSWTDWGLSSSCTSSWTHLINKTWEVYGYSEDVYYSTATSNCTTPIAFTYGSNTFNHGIIYQIRGSIGSVSAQVGTKNGTPISTPTGADSGITIAWTNDRGMVSPSSWIINPSNTYVTAPTSPYFTVKTGYRTADNSSLSISGPSDFMGIQVNVK